MTADFEISLQKLLTVFLFAYAILDGATILTSAYRMPWCNGASELVIYT